MSTLTYDSFDGVIRDAEDINPGETVIFVEQGKEFRLEILQDGEQVYDYSSEEYEWEEYLSGYLKLDGEIVHSAIGDDVPEVVQALWDWLDTQKS